MRINKKVVLGFFAGGVLLTACMVPEQEDPFTRLPEEQTQTLQGEVFPFSVSIPTRTTHRLEKDGKLVAFLASDIVRLDDFEEREVEVRGVFRNEKMRQIFWVEGIKLLDSDTQNPEEEKTHERFVTKTFTFLYPNMWEYSTAPNGTAYFLDKNDENRLVFLTFVVEDVRAQDVPEDPNVLIANMAGQKEILTDESGKRRERITLTSNLYNKKYTFTFTPSDENPDREKEFRRLMSSFVEGAENVDAAVKEDLRKAAEREAAQARKEAEAARMKELERQAEEDATNAGVDTPPNAPDETPTPTDEPEEPEIPAENEPEPDSPEPTPVPEDGSYTNLIDENAFGYESSAWNFSIRVPYGFWFRNYGAMENALIRIGFSNEAFESARDVKFWMDIVETKNPVQTLQEDTLEGGIVIDVPRDEETQFRLYGPAQFRDAMRSIADSIE